MQYRIAEPVGEIAGAAAFAFVRIGLAVAFAGAGRAFDADVEVIVVAVHRPHLVEPVAVAFRLTTERLLDRGIDKDALHAGLLRGSADHRKVAWCEYPGIDIEPVVAHH